MSGEKHAAEAELWPALQEVERLAKAAKIRRLLYRPGRYLGAIFFREYAYKRHRREKAVRCRTFWGAEIQLLLPSGTDIYLLGAKSHPSEIRLARFLLRQLRAGNHFLDIGAHYGYFSLLALRLVGGSGKVWAFEAAPATYAVLAENLRSAPNARAFHKAVSDTSGQVVFHQFPNLYAEYNTLEPQQFQKEGWWASYAPEAVEVQAETLDGLLSGADFQPDIIKVDVEGAEPRVLRGGAAYLERNQPLVVMEYLVGKRGETPYLEAEGFLRKRGYSPFGIKADGGLEPLDDIGAYMQSQGLASDNIVFKALSRLI